MTSNPMKDECIETLKTLNARLTTENQQMADILHDKDELLDKRAGEVQRLELDLALHRESVSHYYELWVAERRCRGLYEKRSDRLSTELVEKGINCE